MNLLRTHNTTDFYLTPKGQIVRFDYDFKPEWITLSSGKKGVPIAVSTFCRGKFLRNGRCFTSVEKAQAYLNRYLYANGFISLSDYRLKTGLKG